MNSPSKIELNSRGLQKGPASAKGEKGSCRIENKTIFIVSCYYDFIFTVVGCCCYYYDTFIPSIEAIQGNNLNMHKYVTVWCTPPYDRVHNSYEKSQYYHYFNTHSSPCLSYRIITVRQTYVRQSLNFHRVNRQKCRKSSGAHNYHTMNRIDSWECMND